MTIPESDVFEAVACLDGYERPSFLKTYVEACVKVTQAHAAGHVGTALTLLGLIAGRKTNLPVGANGQGNLFVCLVAPAGHQKTYAIDLGYRQLASSIHLDIGNTPTKLSTMVVPTPQSPLALLREIKNRNPGVLLWDDWQTFLEQARPTRGPPTPQALVLSELLKAYDCSPLSYTSKAEGTIQISDPRLSCLAAVTPTVLACNTTIDMWRSGFMSRFLMLYVERERQTKWTGLGPRTIESLQAMLQTIHAPTARNNGIKGGKVIDEEGRIEWRDPDALALWEAWTDEMREAPDRDSPELSSVYTRAEGIAGKAALLAALDVGLTTKKQWQIDAACMYFGIAVARWGVESAKKILKLIPAHPEGMEIAAVVAAFRGQLNEWVSDAELATRVNRKTRQFQELIDTLLRQDKITRMILNGETGYLLLKE